MRKQAFNDALAISRLTLSYAVENGDTELIQELNDAIGKTFEEIASSNETDRHRSTDERCSFCGLSPPKVKLGAGPSVRICNECVSSFSEAFNS